MNNYYELQGLNLFESIQIATVVLQKTEFYFKKSENSFFLKRQAKGKKVLGNQKYTL